MSSSAGNIKISPQDVVWEAEEKICIDTKGAVAANLNGKYFNIYDSTTTYDVFYDLDNSMVSNPGSGTGIMVAILSADTAEEIATKTGTAIAAATAYVGTADGTVLVMDFGTTVEIKQDAVDVDTGFAFVGTLRKGGTTDLGLFDGDIETSFEETLLDVTAHQTGLTIITQLRQGVGAGITLTLKEVDPNVYEDIFTASGGDFTPSGGTKLFGWGTAKVGQNTLKNSRRLVFHPVSRDASDKSEDLTFWLSYPTPESIVFSGENPQTVNLSFQVFKDEFRPESINIFAFGDSSQAGITA